jgi:hypothetical protein
MEIRVCDGPPLRLQECGQYAMVLLFAQTIVQYPIEIFGSKGLYKDFYIIGVHCH